MNNEKEVVEAEVVDNKETKKKESSIKDFFNKTKRSINNSILEDKIRSTYRSAHNEFDYYVFGDNSIFSGSCVYGDLDNNELTYYGKAVIPPYSIVIDEKTNKAYYATEKSENVNLDIEVDGTVYTRIGKKILLDDDIIPVDVIKAEGKYYLYKGKK